MLFVDPRVGSGDLLEPLKKYGVPADHADPQLESGDFAFIGRGMQGCAVMIGIELKIARPGSHNDLIKSLYSGRFTGLQIQRMRSTYDRSWLITEGILRANDEGILEIMSGGWKLLRNGTKPIMARDLEKWLLTVTIRGGIQHVHCPTRRDTIRFLSSLYHWWTSKDLEEHRSLDTIYHAPPDQVELFEPSQFLKTVSTFPHVGWEKARAAEVYFGGSLSKALNAPEAEWMQVPGIGKGIAAHIAKALQ